MGLAACPGRRGPVASRGGGIRGVDPGVDPRKGGRMESRMVFVAGAPRSGTTAVTRLLAAHTDVTLADAHGLGTSPDGKPTYESGIFIRIRDDDAVRARFAALDGRTAVIVEKTPMHILHVDRIRRIFPGARFILCHRPPLPCLRSWKKARATFLQHGSFADACAVVARALTALAAQCEAEDVAVVRFNPFMADPAGAGAALLRHLDLDTAQLDQCLADMRDPALERVKGVVGESVLGGATRLSAEEKALVAEICEPANAAVLARRPRLVIRPLRDGADREHGQGARIGSTDRGR
ncbi:MAG: hypothetical protein CML66_05525 [Rhodobacteraceae bacterium]|nr:hypothetical protein [Paracoccaceae bacterium]